MLHGQNWIRIFAIKNQEFEKKFDRFSYVLGSDTEEASREPPRIIRSESMISQSILGTPVSAFEDMNNAEDYETQADDVVEKVWRIFKDDDSWSQEAKSSDGLDIVMTKTFPKWGKVFRLSVKKKI